MPTLKQIDQDLIKLLSERIAIIKSNSRDLQEDTFDATQLLAGFGVPDFVWKSLVTSCAAAVVYGRSDIAAASSSSPHVRSQRVTVIGGHGKMGQFFTQQLSIAGHTVSILEQHNWDDAEKLLGETDLVLVCVPTEHTLAVIRRAAQYLTSSTALADITSIKAPIVQAMLEHHKGPVLGLHPMFGPGVESFLSQNVVACPGRAQLAFQWFLDLIESRGGNLILCTPEEHDRMMVVIQAIRHFSTFSFGVFLAEQGINIGRSLDFSSPLYRLEIDITSRLFAQDASLYLGTMLAAEEHRQAIVKLVATYSRLAQLVAQKDQAALKQEFEATRGTFQQEATRALQESNYVIDSLSVLLAANKAES